MKARVHIMSLGRILSRRILALAVVVVARSRHWRLVEDHGIATCELWNNSWGWCWSGSRGWAEDGGEQSEALVGFTLGPPVHEDERQGEDYNNFPPEANAAVTAVEFEEVNPAIILIAVDGFLDLVVLDVLRKGKGEEKRAEEKGKHIDSKN